MLIKERGIMNKDENHRLREGAALTVKSEKISQWAPLPSGILLRWFLNLWPLTPGFQVKVLSWCNLFWEGTFYTLWINPFRAFAKRCFSALVCVIFRSNLESKAIKVSKPFIRSLPFQKQSSFDLSLLDGTFQSFIFQNFKSGIWLWFDFTSWRHSLNASTWFCAFNTFWGSDDLGRPVPYGLDKVIDFHIPGFGRKG